MLLQINKGTKYFGANDVFNDIQFEIKDNEKIAIVGRNGCGKTTLLKCIVQEEDLDRGNIYRSANLTVGYLSQKVIIDDNITVIEELNKAFEHIFELQKLIDEVQEQMKHDTSEKLLNKYGDLQEQFERVNGYNYKSELETVFCKFGFEKDDLYRPINTFSGGQKTRIAFVKLLISKPDILLLDEPTNHLDLQTIEWLEGYLKKYPKAVVLVSHDRMFLDDVVDVVYELEYGQMKKYVGNYTSFVEQKKNDLEQQMAAYKRQQKEIEHLEELIEKFRYKATKASFAQSKIKFLDRMDKVEEVKQADTKTFKARFKPRYKGGSQVLVIDDLTVGYDRALCNINLTLHSKDRVAIIGPNGCGKSTLIKTLMGLVKPLSGSYLLGHQIETSYFDQQLAQIDSNKTVLDELWSAYPDLDRTQIRNVLGQFQFSADDVFKDVHVLSGGEKVRLTLAKILLEHANFLILDEPTNHLDLVSKEALEESLNDFEGTILFVSHDRYFIKRIANKIIEIDEKGKVSYYDYGYANYMEQKKSLEETIKSETKKESTKRVKPINVKREVSKLETSISEYEEKINELEQLRFNPEYYNDYQKMHELDKEITSLQETVNEMMEKWEELLSEM